MNYSNPNFSLDLTGQTALGDGRQSSGLGLRFAKHPGRRPGRR